MVVHFCIFGDPCQETAPSKCVPVNTSRAVRSDMRGWIVTDEGDRWAVKLDVRDFGGHLDTTVWGWSATLAARVRQVFSLDFYGRLMVMRSMFIPGALHGIEASFLADATLRNLRTAIFLSCLVWPSAPCQCWCSAWFARWSAFCEVWRFGSACLAGTLPVA